MAPKLRVLAGTSTESMIDISSLVNTDKPHQLSSNRFDGEIVTYIKNFVDENENIWDSEYFEREDRYGVSWSIQVRGRFLKPYNANDILFGNTFDRPLQLPWGTSAILKFMRYIDPTLENDLQSTTKPWALSPLISTMPYFKHHRIEDTSTSTSKSALTDDASATRPTSPFPSTHSLVDSTIDLYKTVSEETNTNPDNDNGNSGTDSLTNTQFENSNARRAYFSDEKNRQKVVFGPLDVITTDFCYGFLDFSPLCLSIGGGLSFDLTRYWDGQPVRFVCCERKVKVDGDKKDDKDEDKKDDKDDDKDEDDGNPWGRIFWCVAIEMRDESEDEDEDGEEDENENGDGDEGSKDDID